jgi:hypothetical protein
VITGFSTTVNGMECLCRVTHYRPYVSARCVVPIDDSEEAIPSEFEFIITDTRGTPLPHLTGFAQADEPTFDRLQDEYEAAVLADKHGKDF